MVSAGFCEGPGGDVGAGEHGHRYEEGFGVVLGLIYGFRKSCEHEEDRIPMVGDSAVAVRSCSDLHRKLLDHAEQGVEV